MLGIRGQKDRKLKILELELTALFGSLLLTRPSGSTTLSKMFSTLWMELPHKSQLDLAGCLGLLTAQVEFTKDSLQAGFKGLAVQKTLALVLMDPCGLSAAAQKAVAGASTDT